MTKKAKPNARDPIETTWCGVPRFECPICGADSLDLPKIVEHIRIVHPVPVDLTTAYGQTATVDAPAVDEPVTPAAAPEKDA